MTRIRQYEMTQAQWAAQNPVLLKGEVGWETPAAGQPAKAKKGDGVTAWNSLVYSVQPSAPTASPVFTGDPKAPTPATSDNDTSIATTAFVKAAIAALVAGSPTLLDTLDELAQAIGDDPNFAATMTTALGTKAPTASPTFTGDPKAPTPATADNDTSIATTAFVNAFAIAQRSVTEILTGKTLTDPSNVVSKRTLTNPVKVSAYRAAAQNTVGASFTTVSLDTEMFDTGNNFASSVFTAPVAGFYQVSFQVVSGASVSRWAAGVFKNGTTTEIIRGSEVAVSAGAFPAASGGSKLVQLAAADTLRLMVFSSSAVAIQTGETQTYMTISLDSAS
jgi:hypothetical protein